MHNSMLTKTIIVDRLGYPSMSIHYLKVRVNYCPLGTGQYAKWWCAMQGTQKVKEDPSTEVE